jgi:hypothetical protein
MKTNLTIEQLATELENAEKRLESDPSNLTLQRIVKNRKSDTATVLVHQGSKSIRCLMTVEGWKSFKSGTKKVVFTGSTFCLMTPEEIEKHHKWNTEIAKEFEKAWRK